MNYRRPSVVVLGLLIVSAASFGIFVKFFGSAASLQPKPVKPGQTIRTSPIAKIRCGESHAERSEHTNRVDVVDTPSAQEMTEHYDNGSYEVTKCDSQGKLKTSQLVEPLTDGVGEKVLATSVTTTPAGDKTQSLQIDYVPIARFTPEIRAEVGSGTLPPTARPSRRIIPTAEQKKPAVSTIEKHSLALIDQALALDPACIAVNDYNFSYSPRKKWPSKKYTWYFDSSTFGDASKFLSQAVRAHNVWSLTYTDCHKPNQSSVSRFNFYYGGSVASSGTFNVSNLKNAIWSVDNIGGGCGKTYALMCTRVWYWPGTSNLAEADIITARSNHPYPNIGRLIWSDIYGCPSGRLCVDFEGVLVHEIGHTLGLAHAQYSYQTMYPSCSYCYSQRTLGVGDLRGLYILYPW